ncbi:MAG: TonB-dependent receptor [Flavisolibacter sp.]|nr:TonB-dependent receptor [Flavisolibacter sp.]
MKKIKLFIVGVCLTFFSAAQDTTSVLKEVVVTTNKYPKKQSQTGKVVTVLDQTTLRQMGNRTISEMLNTVAGVTINGANNNLGTNQGVSIRGTSFGNTLILIDGIPVNDPSVTANYFDLNFVNPRQVERIEIVRGGLSTLYGSDAVAGVINIITKKAPPQPLRFSTQLTAGSYHTFEGTAGISGRTEKINYNLQHTLVRSSGFSAAYDSTGSKDFDNDSYQQNILRGDVGFILSDVLSLSLFGNYSYYKAGIDAAAFTDDKDFITKNKNYQVGTGITWKQKNGSLQFNYHYNYVNRFYLDDSTDKSNVFAYYFNSMYIGRTHFTELYKTTKWQTWELLTGIDYRRNSTMQDYFSTGTYGPFSTPKLDTGIWQVSPYASLVYNHTRWNIESGGRWNYHSTYGSNFTYTFNPSYLINDHIKLFGNIASAFKAPSLYQLYDAYAGNKNLAPETSHTLEGGAEWYAVPGTHIRLTGFHRNIDNAIQYIITNPITFEAQYRNVNNQKNYGLETEIQYRREKWNISTNYTFTKGRISSKYAEAGLLLNKDTTYNNLYRVPSHALNVFAGYAVTSKLHLNSLARYVGSRLEPVYGKAPVKLDDYLTIDVSASYRFSDHVRVFADLKNITNQRYFDILGYTARRFNAFAGVSLEL